MIASGGGASSHRRGDCHPSRSVARAEPATRNASNVGAANARWFRHAAARSGGWRASLASKMRCRSAPPPEVDWDKNSSVPDNGGSSASMRSISIESVARRTPPGSLTASTEKITRGSDTPEGTVRLIPLVSGTRKAGAGSPGTKGPVRGQGGGSVNASWPSEPATSRQVIHRCRRLLDAIQRKYERQRRDGPFTTTRTQF